MLSGLKKWLEPPHFEGDEEKSAMARLLNSLIINLGLTLLVALLVLVPFFVVQKLGSTINLGILLIGLVITRQLIFKGYVSQSGIALAFLSWGSFLVLTLFSGGSNSPAMFYLACATIVSGFILKRWLAFGLTIFTVIITLVITLLKAEGIELPMVFIFTPVTTWLAFGLGLMFMATTRNLYMDSLENALARARSENTARKNSEESLRESEARYKSMFEDNHAIILVMDAGDGKIVDANPAASAWYGWSRETLLKMKISEINAQTKGEINAEMAQARNEQRNHFLFKHRRADGSVRDVEVFSGPLAHTGRGLLYSIVHDITEQVEAEAALAESEASYRGLFDTVGEGIYILERDGRFLDVNPGAARIHGYAREVLIGKTPDFIAAPGKNDLPGVIENVMRAFEGEPQQFEFWGLRQNGEIFLIDVHLYKGVYFGKSVVIALGQDITGRKQAEQALQASEAKFRAVVENSNDGILFTDASAKVLYRSPSYNQINGFTDEERLGRNGFDTVHPGDLKGLAHYWQKLVEKPESAIKYEYRIRHRDGSWRWMESTGKNLLSNPDVEAVVVNSRDITERKEKEVELSEERASLAQKVEERTADLRLANTELVHAARMKEEFLASMSHELRKPLTGSLGLSEALKMKIYGELNPKQFDSIANIEKSGRHLLTLINDILDLSKVSAGMIDLDPGSVVIREVCRSSIQMVRQTAHDKQIKVNLEIAEGADEFEADERRLKQILVNLLSNAVKFTPDGGEVGLQVKGDAPNQRMLFTVWDHGIGIQPGDLARLFKPFTQLDSAFSRQYNGTGLGLSLVLKMVELHGGGVTVESQPGMGSRFSVTLPWKKRLKAGEEALAQTGSLADAGEGRAAPLILVVEDNQLYLDLLVDILAHSGYRVTTAQNGEEGIARARENRPDLILMDIQMPVLDGFQAARRIRSDPNLETVPIIALTALAMSGDREKCFEAGMNDYLSKPVNIDELKRTVKTLLRREAQRQNEPGGRDA